jgi:transcriptional regulator with XRE-family HTH domain
MNDLGKALRLGRQKNGWTLRQAQERTGVSNGYLSLMEHGRVKAPSPTYLRRLADQYGLAYTVLMRLAGHPVEGELPSSEEDSGDSQQLAETSPVASRLRSVGAEAQFAVGPTNPSIALRLTASNSAPAPLSAVDFIDLSLEEVAQVRAFIAGLKAGRRE